MSQWKSPRSHCMGVCLAPEAAWTICRRDISFSAVENRTAILGVPVRRLLICRDLLTHVNLSITRLPPPLFLLYFVVKYAEVGLCLLKSCYPMRNCGARWGSITDSYVDSRWKRRGLCIYLWRNSRSYPLHNRVIMPQNHSLGWWRSKNSVPAGNGTLLLQPKATMSLFVSFFLLFVILFWLSLCSFLCLFCFLSFSFMFLWVSRIYLPISLSMFFCTASRNVGKCLPSAHECTRRFLEVIHS